MTTASRIVYFTDENTLGLGKLLHRSGRDDVVFPGHEDLPEVALGTLDLDWMPVVGERGYVVITRDKHIRTRPAELRAYLEHGIRSVWLGAKQDLGPRDQLELFLAHEFRLEREITKTWCRTVGARDERHRRTPPQPPLGPASLIRRPCAEVESLLIRHEPPLVRLLPARS